MSFLSRCKPDPSVGEGLAYTHIVFVRIGKTDMFVWRNKITVLNVHLKRQELLAYKAENVDP